MRSTPIVSRVAAIATAVAVIALVAGASLLGAGCGSSSKAPNTKELILATTTSVKDSGLLDEAVLPAFQKLHPELTIKTVAVGSGEAIAMGQRGDADVLLVHSPKDEATFMASGAGTLRLPIAYNFFVIVGPASDPAGIRGAATAADAFKAIAAKQATFVSRGDASGTNKKELGLWNLAGVTSDAKAAPVGSWYVSTGQGMGETLQIASEKQSYTLTDLATFLTMKSQLQLTIFSKNTPDLKNQYSVIVVNQAMHPTVNSSGAELFAAFLTSPEGQKLIGAFGDDKFGQPLYFADAGILGTAQ
jgi:tungstate transport system substrate-binding protein